MAFIEKPFEVSRLQKKSKFSIFAKRQPNRTQWSREDRINKDLLTRMKAKTSYRKALRLKLSELLEDSS